jgi:hypothetical protein
MFENVISYTAVTIEEHEGDNRESLWSCQTAQGKVAVNMNSCTCSFYKSTEYITFFVFGVICTN